ncbi:MAG TPA: hypothetical protein VFH58_15855 [Acidimicrobiales bacterium]|nr:hypothetical protein [Acidimicrobiales bacterium]
MTGTTSTSTVLDEAFERMAASSAFELPNGFVNHGPMGVEALAAMGLEDTIDEWARRFERVPGPAVAGLPTAELDWKDALGDYRLLPEWIGHLELSIGEHGWQEVVEVWVPRLMPALSTKLFHGAIHVGHAVRALTVADTPSRRTELARALGYWAARYQPGQSATVGGPEYDGDLGTAVVTEAAAAARYYLADPSILNLHGVTGAMAVQLLVDHIPPAAGEAALAQVRAEHAALYQGSEAVKDVRTAGVEADAVACGAASSGDVHAVKLVEACRRGLAVTGDPVFSAAAETVTSMAVIA